MVATMNGRAATVGSRGRLPGETLGQMLNRLCWGFALAREVEAEHEAGLAAARRERVHYYRAGLALIEARTECFRRGEPWLEWLRRSMKKVKRARAYHYIAFAEFLVTRNLAPDGPAGEEAWRRASRNAPKRTKAKTADDVPDDGSLELPINPLPLDLAKEIEPKLADLNWGAEEVRPGRRAGTRPLRGRRG